MHPFNSREILRKPWLNILVASMQLPLIVVHPFLLLARAYLKVDEVTIPKRTYPSVPCSIIHAVVVFDLKTLSGLAYT